MLRRGFPVALALLPLAAHALDESALITGVRARLVDGPVQRGAFEQRKTVQGFKHPLVSRGEWVLARGRGVAWHTREPYASTLVVTPDRLVMHAGEGTTVTRIEARDEPALRTVNQALFALMSADLRTLAQGFRIHGELHARGWSMVLVPREGTPTRWIARIELDGDRHLREVRLHETEGDRSVIRLSGHAVVQALTPQEEAGFE
jgi:hypothetical protein